MPILKVKSKKGGSEETKLVGVHLPRQVSDYLTLYSIAHGITKTIVIRNGVQHWWESQMEKEEDLVKLIIKKARVEQKKWEDDPATSSAHRVFKMKLKADLEQREINPDYIKIILTAL